MSDFLDIAVEPLHREYRVGWFQKGYIHFEIGGEKVDIPIEVWRNILENYNQKWTENS